jgi:TatD DNase family protein
MLVDTHSHIHDANYPLDIGDVLARAHHKGINQIICVGTSEQSSRDALAFAKQHEHIYAAIGVHPHDTQDGFGAIGELLASGETPVAIGEIGLDYFYGHSPRAVQINALEAQLDLAARYNLPVIFHVREAFDDFWPIFDNFSGLRGVLHSFTDVQANVDKAFARGLLIGVNGISTFTKDEIQRTMFAGLPLDRLVFETDAPFLTPSPFRGTVNEPAFVRTIAEHHAVIRGLTLDDIAAATTANARALFAL